jgi:streptogramin lyase
VITEYGIDAGITDGSAPTQIVTGPDGNLWFTETLNNAIGKITTAGAITEYPAEANGLSAGPDGNLWFTGTDMIGRVLLNAPKPALVKKIICTKGKQQKSVIGKCPTGWKKKA